MTILCVAVALFILLSALNAQDAEPQFTDHGVAVPLAEARGVVTTQDAAGHSLTICNTLDLCSSGWILVTDIDSGESTRIDTPDGVGNSPAYGSCLASNGKFYTAQGNVLLEFDPDTRAWSWHDRPTNQASAYLWFEEGPDGTIWAGGYSGTALVSFNPKTREAKFHGKMDEKEQYLNRLAIADDGWVYGGIGTQRGNIVAYNSQTGDMVQLVPADQRTTGTATVYRAIDGTIYGQCTLKDGNHNYRLAGGIATEIPRAEMGPKAPSGSIYWGQTTGIFPDGRKLTAYSLVDKYMVIQSPDGTTRRIDFDYESEGSVIRVLTGGPDDKVHCNSAHPSREAVYDPVADTLTYQLGAIARKGFATQGKYIIGGHYSGGMLYIHDTSKPWNMAGTPATISGGVLAEDLTKLAHTDAGKIDYIADYKLVLFRAGKYGDSVHFDLNTTEKGLHYLVIAPFKSPGYCTVSFALDGKEIGKPYEGNAAAVAPGPAQVFGPFNLKKGRHTVSARTVKAAAGNPWLGITQIALTAQRPEELIAAAQEPNPKLVAEFAPDINVPWGACAHPDGKHVMISGNPGYGYVGGGIGIYNIETGEISLLKHTDLIPGHCVMSMVALDDGDIFCGSSIAGGHGATGEATEAVLFLLDWDTKKISFTTAPVEGAHEIGLMRLGHDGKLYGIADTTLFVFDPATREVIHTQPLAEYGSRAVNGLTVADDGNLYAVFSKAILRISPGNFEVTKIADTPRGENAGIAIIDNRLYFAVNSHLWSIELP